MRDLCDLAHVAGWESYCLHDIGRVSWFEPVLYRSCTTSLKGHGRIYELNRLDHLVPHLPL